MDHIKLKRVHYPIRVKTEPFHHRPIPSRPKTQLNVPTRPTPHNPRNITTPADPPPVIKPEITVENIKIPKLPTTTILITAYKRTNQLMWGLTSLANQKTKYKFDVLVLNDGLPDDTESICESFKDRLDIKYVFTGHRNLKLEIPHWRVPGFAFNIGCKLTESDIIFLSCAEMYHVDSFSLDKCISHLVKYPNSTVTPSGKNDAVGRGRFKKDGELLAKLNECKLLTRKDLESDHCANLDTKYPYFMGMVRKHYMNIGGYDEDFHGICADDDDLIYRLQTYGLVPKIIDAKVVHLWHERVAMNKDRKKQNLDLYLSRMRPDNLIRNKNKNWGIEPMLNINTRTEIKRIQPIISKPIKESALVTIPKNPITTILITTFNRPIHLKWGLTSIAKQVCKYPFDIIVLNDATPDDTESICESFKDKLNIKYVFTGSRNLTPGGMKWRGPGFAFNIGAQLTNADIIFLDCPEMYLVDNNVIEKYINAIISNPCSSITSLGKDDGRYSLATWFNNSTKYSDRYLDYGPILNKLNEKGFLTVEDLEDGVSVSLTGEEPYFIGLPRKPFMDIRGYDEDFIGVCADDNDLLYRLKTYGVQPRIIDCKLVHLWHPRSDIDKDKWQYNYDLYISRMKPDNIIRNLGRDWGVLK